MVRQLRYQLEIRGKVRGCSISHTDVAHFFSQVIHQRSQPTHLSPRGHSSIPRRVAHLTSVLHNWSPINVCHPKPSLTPSRSQTIINTIHKSAYLTPYATDNITRPTRRPRQRRDQKPIPDINPHQIHQKENGRSDRGRGRRRRPPPRDIRRRDFLPIV